MYGFNIDNLGAVSEGYTSFTLLDHGYARLVPSKHPFSLFFKNMWKFDVPKSGGDVKYLVFFLTTENSRIFIASEGECVAFSGMSRPYVYVYSNVVQKAREEYGMEVFNKDGKLIYNSTSKPLKILKSANADEVYNTVFGRGRGVAVSVIGSMFGFMVNPSQGVVRYGFSHISKSGAMLLSGAEEGMIVGGFSPSVANDLFRYFGRNSGKSKPLITVIDVSDIKRKE